MKLQCHLKMAVGKRQCLSAEVEHLNDINPTDRANQSYHGATPFGQGNFFKSRIVCQYCGQIGLLAISHQPDLCVILELINKRRTCLEIINHAYSSALMDT